ncbi:MAG: glutathione S-transferase family protein [Myxococcota bacterium]
MAHTIYGARGTGSGIIEAACAELGLEYETRDLDARNNEHRGEDYARINPQRKLPALVMASGETLTEALAILLTLDERNPGVLLPPAGTADRASAIRWMAFVAAEIYPLIEMEDYPERFAPDSPAALKERAQALLKERWRVVENAIASPYCVPSGYGAADLYITKVADWLDADWRRQHLPKTESLMAKVRARPSLAAVWARHMPS